MDMIKRFTADDNFIGRYERLIKDKVIPYQENVLNDRIPGVEPSHCIENFKLAAEYLKEGKCSGEFYGMVFQDSDVAKWLEGAAYSLVMFPDKELEKICDDVIDIIGSAQHEDGYLNTYFTVKEPEKRWMCLSEAHELYCAGHLIEAAVAYAECTGKTRFLDIMKGMADHIYDHFITKGNAGCSGHPEVELALMRLYRCTGDEKYKELALHFIDVRGVDGDFYINERKKADGWSIWNSNLNDKEYMQAHAPVREQKDAVGHAVRAVYLYTAMADIAAETGDETLKEACHTLWDSITKRRMYVTGAIGSAYEGEAFTRDYHLPNDTAYAETCASIGLIFFAKQMQKLEKNGKYADTIERALYNCVLAGMELDGTKFFYVNPLEVVPGISNKARGHHHVLPKRPNWFACACCPPNVARLLPSIAEYAWESDEDTLYSNLYIGGTLDVSDIHGGKVTVSTGYPYDGKVIYKFMPSGEKMDMTFAIRVPAWSKDTKISKNGAEALYEIKDGYAYIRGSFAAGDEITVDFDMSVRKIYAHTKVSADSGKVAFSRGPLVYCAEGIDNNDDILGLSVKKDTDIKVCGYDADKLNGICEIKVEGTLSIGNDDLYSYDEPQEKDVEITLIPYYAWSNRDENQMRVWIPER